MRSEFSNTWNYHRDFDIMHFGNPEAVRPEDESWPPPPKGEEDAFEDVNPWKRKKKRYLRQPKGWFRT